MNYSFWVGSVTNVGVREDFCLFLVQFYFICMCVYQRGIMIKGETKAQIGNEDNMHFLSKTYINGVSCIYVCVFFVVVICICVSAPWTERKKE